MVDYRVTNPLIMEPEDLIGPQKDHRSALIYPPDYLVVGSPFSGESDDGLQPDRFLHRPDIVIMGCTGSEYHGE